jgi:hypothetical protein
MFVSVARAGCESGGTTRTCAGYTLLFSALTHAPGGLHPAPRRSHEAGHSISAGAAGGRGRHQRPKYCERNGNIAATFIGLNVWCELIVNVAQFGQTPLMIAAMTENIPLMFVLHAAGARVDLRDKVRSVLYWDISIVVTCLRLPHRGCRAEGRSPITQRRRFWGTATVTSFVASTCSPYVVDPGWHATLL